MMNTLRISVVFLLTFLSLQLCDAAPRNRETSPRSRSEAEEDDRSRGSVVRRLPDLTAQVDISRRRHPHLRRRTDDGGFGAALHILKQITKTLERAKKKGGRAPSDLKSIPPVDAPYPGKARSAVNTIRRGPSRVPNALNLRQRLRSSRGRNAQRRRISIPDLSVRLRRRH